MGNGRRWQTSRIPLAPTTAFLANALVANALVASVLVASVLVASVLAVAGAVAAGAVVAGAAVVAGGTSPAVRAPVAEAPHGIAAGLAGDGFGFCAMLRSGGAECWGSNISGALGGGGTESQSNVPVTVKGLVGVASLATDGNGWCALLRSGEAKCWGSNAEGALGNGRDEPQSDVPVTVEDVARATALVGGYDGYCVLVGSNGVGNGGAKCWGDNFEGALGAGGNEAFSSVPVPVKGLTAAKGLTFSGGYGYCALLSNGGARCWGYNGSGVLGDGGAEISAAAPVVVRGLVGPTSLVSDGHGYCALLKTSGAKCWGSNGDGVSGALGNGNSEAQSNVPVAVKGLTHIVSLVSNGHGYCALVAGGAAKCWGSNFGGTLGDGGGEAQSNVPVTVKGLAAAASLVSDGRGYCALLSKGGACVGAITLTASSVTG